MTNTLKHRQKGASAFGTLITLGLLIYAGIVGFQYIPQLIEWGTVNSMLDSLHSQQISQPASSVQAVEANVDRLLNLNEMRDMAENFTVRKDSEGYLVVVNYDRELNLLYTTKTIHYEKTLSLR